jgi:Leucine-rich repeat (LRR) protein
MYYILTPRSTKWVGISPHAFDNLRPSQQADIMGINFRDPDKFYYNLAKFSNLKILRIGNFDYPYKDIYMDISRNIQLTVIEIRHMCLNSIDVRHLPDLKELLLMDLPYLNQCSDSGYCKCDTQHPIDLSQNINLEHLTVVNCRQSYLDLTHNINLRSLNVRFNELSALRVNHLTQLLDLVVSRNLLTDIDLTGLKRLRRLIVSKNQLSSINLIDQLGLVHFEGSHNPWVISPPIDEICCDPSYIQSNIVPSTDGVVVYHYAMVPMCNSSYCARNIIVIDM